MARRNVEARRSAAVLVCGLLATACAAPGERGEGPGPGVFAGIPGMENRTAPPSAELPPRKQRVVRDAPPPARLKGMSLEQLTSALGEPTLTRREAGATLVQYANDSCGLLLFLYPQESGVLTVTHLEASPGGASDRAVKACLQALENGGRLAS